jgi:hypothetical protein
MEHGAAPKVSGRERTTWTGGLGKGLWRFAQSGRFGYTDGRVGYPQGQPYDKDHLFLFALCVVFSGGYYGE